MRAQFINEIEFNLKKNPTDRFRGGFEKGISRRSSENLRKKREGLTPEEQEIVQRHEQRISELRNEIYDYEGEIEGLENEYEILISQDFDAAELEQFYADVQNDYGFEALDILNSGGSMEEKIKAIDALNPTKDFGIREFKDLANNYQYYHPEEASEEEKEKIKSQIKKLQRQKKERENTMDKLETKIYNLENY